ncbi:MAG: alanine/glycine:cation symporter family protein [Actinomycetaceae bacterium]|nr:alanine/glycine:cation symporter family protein [Actinomycetaceae bacterium]
MNEPQTLSELINQHLVTIVDFLYWNALIWLLVFGGLYFFIRSAALPIRMFVESIRVVTEPPDEEGQISSFRALMVSTASRVGVGNIAGVGTAIALGGAGSVFWMWLIAMLGSTSAFVESTLAQIYKKRTPDGGHSVGGPAYYIQLALKQKWLAIIFAVALIATYMGGFNLVASFNVADTFTAYTWYHPNWTPYVIGFVLAVAFALSIFGGTRHLTNVAGTLVPIMATIYLVVGAYVVLVNWQNIPGMFAQIFAGASDITSLFGGAIGAAMSNGIKRGLYSNEAGIGSAPNAAATASVSHPVKQGLVQMLSVFIDTMVVCSITAFVVLSSGVQGSDQLKGTPLVASAMSTALGHFALPFITFALVLFAFTTLIGNFYYAEVNLHFLSGEKKTPRWLLMAFRGVACVVVFFGALADFSIAWNLADILMSIMALINVPVILILGGKAFAAAKDYCAQKAEGKNPTFTAASIGIKEKLDYWQ